MRLGMRRDSSSSPRRTGSTAIPHPRMPGAMDGPTDPSSPILPSPTLAGLPDDALGALLDVCDVRAVGRIALTSRRLAEVVSRPTTWRAHLLRLMGVPPGREAVVEEELEGGGDGGAGGVRSMVRAAVRLGWTTADLEARRRASNRAGSSRELVGVEVSGYCFKRDASISIDSVGWNKYQVGTNEDSRGWENFCATFDPRRIPCRYEAGASHAPVLRRRRDGGRVAIRMSSTSYFECRLVRRARAPRRVNVTPCVAIGLCNGDFECRGNQPGWTNEGLAYHGDDGHIYHGSGSGLSYGPTFGGGDVVGCGLHNPSGSVFFTKNGSLIGTAFAVRPEDPYDFSQGIRPVIGLDSQEYTVIVNFGSDEPFRLDVGLAEQLYSAHPPRWRNSSKKRALDNSQTAPLNAARTFQEAVHFHPWTKDFAPGFTARITIQTGFDSSSSDSDYLFPHHY